MDEETNKQIEIDKINSDNLLESNQNFTNEINELNNQIIQNKIDIDEILAQKTASENLVGVLKNQLAEEKKVTKPATPELSENNNNTTNLPHKKAVEKQGLKSTAILALGYRDIKTDWLVKLKKIREPLSEFVTVIK